jgi:hypothetical protein
MTPSQQKVVDMIVKNHKVDLTTLVVTEIPAIVGTKTKDISVKFFSNYWNRSESRLITKNGRIIR